MPPSEVKQVLPQILKWGNADAFYLIAVLLVVVAIYFYFDYINKNKLNKYFGQKVAAWLSQSVTIPKRRLQFFLQMLGLLFLIVALARQIGRAHV